MPGAITSKDQVKGLIATTTIFADEQVTVRRFSPVEEAGIRAELKGNQRAIQLSGDPHQILAGTLKKGDHVDVVANFRVRSRTTTTSTPITRTVLRNLLVVRAPAGDGGTSKLASASGQTAVVQLRVTDNQAQKLYFAYKNSDSWHLDMRAASKATDSSETLETINSEICDGVRKSVLCVGRVFR